MRVLDGVAMLVHHTLISHWLTKGQRSGHLPKKNDEQRYRAGRSRLHVRLFELAGERSTVQNFTGGFVLNRRVDLPPSPGRLSTDASSSPHAPDTLIDCHTGARKMAVELATRSTGPSPGRRSRRASMISGRATILHRVRALRDIVNHGDALVLENRLDSKRAPRTGRSC